MKKAEWKISGMHCGGCAAGIEFMLSIKKGVKESHVNYKTKTLNITFDPRKINEGNIVRCLEELGYKIRK